jgi:hypothetical protein
VVDRARQILKKPLQGNRIGGRRAHSADVERGLVEAVGISTGEDDIGALGACLPGRFEPDAGAAADHDDGLAEQRGRQLSAASIVSVPGAGW